MAKCKGCEKKQQTQFYVVLDRNGVETSRHGKESAARLTARTIGGTYRRLTYTEATR